MHSPVVMSLRWLTESQQASLAAQLTHASQSIVNEWRCGFDESQFVVSGVQDNAESVSSGQWFEVVSDVGRLIEIHLNSDWARQILNLPTGSGLSMSGSGDLLDNLERDFLEALSRRIIPEVLAPGLKIERISRHGCGAVVKGIRQVFSLLSARQVNCGHFVLSGKLVDQLVPRIRQKAGSAPISRRSAIGNQSVLIKAHVGQVDVSFSALQSLMLGDVLLLEAPLSEPISLRSEANELVGMGSLGKQDQHRVVRLSSIAANEQVDRIGAVKRSI